MKTIKLLSIIFLVYVYGLSSAQVMFQKTYGGNTADGSRSVFRTIDNGYIMIGHTLSFGVGNTAVYIIKTDLNGDTLWTKTIGGINYGDYGRTVTQTTDGGYIIAGTYGGGAYIFNDILLIKIDSNANLEWTKTYGGTESDHGYSVKLTLDGGYIVAGDTGSFGADSSDVYLIKTDSNGDTLWTKIYNSPSEDFAFDMQQTIDGGYIIGGAAGLDMYLLKTDTSGNIQWAKKIGGINKDYGYSVKQTTDGGYIFVGTTNSFLNGDDDIYLIKTDSYGDTLWTKSYGGSSQEVGTSVQQTFDNGYIVAGYTYSFGAGSHDVFLFKTDANGNLLWSKTYGGPYSDMGISVLQTSDQGYVIAGNTDSYSPGSYDVYLIKTDSNGNTSCNQGSPLTTVNSPATHVLNVIPNITTGAIVTVPVVIVGKGGTLKNPCALSINELPAEAPVDIYPNPFSTEITVNQTSSTGEFILMDITGKEVLRQKTVEGNTILSTLDLTPGLYVGCYTEKSKFSNIKLTKYR